jgi:LuxR family glucitol operon transcriptional activator
MTTSNKNAVFGNLLKGAINGIANYEGKTAPIIEEELGELLGVSGKTIQRYKTGYLPPFERDNDAVRVLADAAVRRGFLGREWLERFLHAARYPATEKLLDELCPVLAPRPKAERVYENLPAPTYDQFVMRQQAFAEVVDGLSSRSATVLIVGMGGNGKTSLAREVAAQCLQDSSDVPQFDAVVWVSDKDNPGTTNQSIVLDTIARALDYPGFTQYNHDEKQYDVEQLLRRQKVLLIIDNAETITDGALFTWLLRLPEPSKAIITTREYQRAYRRGGWPVELRGMSEDEARTLLQQRLERLRIAHLVHDPVQLEPLLAATGGNPKAITMVAGLLKYERRPLQQIVDDLYAARGDLFDDLFSRAWALLDETGKRILMVMTFFPDSTNGKTLSVTADVTGFDFHRATESLINLALLDVQQADLTSAPRYVLHPLVRSFAGAQLAKQSEFEEVARGRWIRWYMQFAEELNYNWDDITQLGLLDSEHGNVYAAVWWAFHKGLYSEVVHILNDIEYYYYVRGLWSISLSMHSMHSASAHQLGDVAEEARAVAFRVHLLSRQGNVDTAQDDLAHLQDLTQVENVPDDVAFWIQHAVASYLFARGDISGAQDAWEKALRYSELLGTQQNISVRQWLATCYYCNDDAEQAQRIFDDTLSESVEQQYIRGIIRSQLGLAVIALDQERFEFCEQRLDDSLQKVRQFGDREYLAQVQRTYADLNMLKGNVAEAHRCLDDAIDLFERIGMRREVVESREKLARLEAMMVNGEGR